MIDQQYLERFSREHESMSREVEGGLVRKDGLVVGHKHDIEKLNYWLVRLCVDYSNLDGETRVTVREVINEHLLVELLYLPMTFRELIRSPADVEQVMIGLVALAIVDYRFDKREYYDVFYKLCRTSRNAGLPIGTLLRKVALLEGSMSEGTRETWLTSAEHYETQAVMVAEVLNRLLALKAGLASFKADTGSYPEGRHPSETSGLLDLARRPPDMANWNGPYLAGLPRDPWDRDYVYVCPGTHTASGYPYDLLSLGPPGEAYALRNWDRPELNPEGGRQRPSAAGRMPHHFRSAPQRPGSHPRSFGSIRG